MINIYFLCCEKKICTSFNPEFLVCGLLNPTICFVKILYSFSAFFKIILTSVVWEKNYKQTYTCKIWKVMTKKVARRCVESITFLKFPFLAKELRKVHLEERISKTIILVLMASDAENHGKSSMTS